MEQIIAFRHRLFDFSSLISSLLSSLIFLCRFSIPLQVTGISLSPNDDQLIVIHRLHNDLVICLDNKKGATRVSELLANIYLQIYQYVNTASTLFPFSSKVEWLGRAKFWTRPVCAACISPTPVFFCHSKEKRKGLHEWKHRWTVLTSRRVLLRVALHIPTFVRSRAHIRCYANRTYQNVFNSFRLVRFSLWMFMNTSIKSSVVRGMISVRIPCVRLVHNRSMGNLNKCSLHEVIATTWKQLYDLYDKQLSQHRRFVFVFE